MYFLIDDDDLLEKYNIIWDEVSADIEKEFNSKPVFSLKTLKKQNKILWWWSYIFLRHRNS